MNKQPLRIAILQRVCTQYRLRLFQELSQVDDWKIKVFIGDDLPNSKVRSAPNFGELDVLRLKTYFFAIGKRVFIVHRKLLQALREFKPDVILCEGESNIISYLIAIYYRLFHRQVAILHWSLGGIPGNETAVFSVRKFMKRALLSLFDKYIVYSSYGKKALIALGCKSENIYVAVNVSDTSFHLTASEQLLLTKEQAREELGLPERFTALYVGAIEPRKRIDELLAAIECTDPYIYNLVIVGNGVLTDRLSAYVQKRRLASVYFPGRAMGELLAKYYRASDVLILPGRGGMVISEAMAHSLPVIVYQADGTEYDLVQHNENGLLLETGSPNEIKNALKYLRGDPMLRIKMGARGREMIKDYYNLESMVNVIQTAIHAAESSRVH